MFKWGLFQECKFGLPFEIRVSHILRNKHKCMITSVGTKKVFERIQYLMKEKKLKNIVWERTCSRIMKEKKMIKCKFRIVTFE